VTVRENKERQEFVSWDSILQVIEHAPTTEWKALIAFVRLVGVRVPSELAGLTWADLDFVAKRIVIKSPKTAHHGGEHALRSCPMFPEVVPFLEALASAVVPGISTPLSAPVFPLARNPSANLRTSLNRMIVAAGLTPWQKTFVNLRSSRETELLAVFPVADVCRWFGHSAAVAARFYAQARSEIADRASSERTLAHPVGKQVGNIGEENGENQDPSRDNHDTSRIEETPPKTSVLRGSDGSAELCDDDDQWTILDSNQRPPRCQRGALTN